MNYLKKYCAVILLSFLFAAGIAAAGGSSDSKPIDYQWSVPGFTTDFTRMLINPDEILSGGPQKDGIPAIDNPLYTSLEDAAGWLEGNEPVILVRIGDKSRIYPLQILMWHEIINDELGGLPITVTFCPLCNTGIVFNRNFSGNTLDFGTTGRLRNSNLIMYDRQTESWWQQATGEAVIGEYAGKNLVMIPALTLSFSEAQTAAPTAVVISRETGFSRPYGQNPYTGYDTPGNKPFLFQGTIDTEHDAMDRVLVVKHKGEELIIAYSEVKDGGILQLSIAGDPVVLFWTSGASSALDAGRLSEGRDVGSLNAFISEVSDKSLAFSGTSAGLFMDAETGSTWSGSGIAIEGTLAGTRLTPVTAVQHFWFSAQAF